MIITPHPGEFARLTGLRRVEVSWGDTQKADVERAPGRFDVHVHIDDPDTADPADGQATAAASDAAETADEGVPAWVWVTGILGVLVVAAAMGLVFRRARAIDGASGGRPGSEG